MNYSEFKENLKKITKATFLKCAKNLKAEEICGFGIYTDESVMSMSICCNTLTHLKDLQQEEKGNDEYFKWSINEWQYEMINEIHVAKINEELLNEHRKISDNQILFEKHKDKILNIAVEVLQELKQESLFKNLNREFVLMFGISDFDDKEIEKAIAQRLNDATQFMQFKNWLDSEE